MNETVKICKLNLVVIVCVVLYLVKLRTIKYLHSNDAKNIKEKSENIEKFYDDRHNFYER